MCHKPLCSQCRKTIGGADFCSDSCASRYTVFQQRYVKKRPARRVTSHGSLVKLLLSIIVLIVIVMGISRILSDKGINIFKEANKAIQRFLYHAEEL